MSDENLARDKANRYLFLKHMKSNGLFTSDVILCTKYYGPGNTRFLWKENPTDPDHLTLRDNVIKSVERELPKYFSRAHKTKV